MLPDLTLAIPESPEVQARERRKAAVRAALEARGTRVVVTPILLAANIAIFLLVAVQEGQIFTIDADTLLRWGGSYSPDVTQGAWWRLITAVFLHGGILHLVFNMLALAMIGPVTERLFGSRVFAVLYALAGIGGAVASEWWQPVSIGVGASGAILGLYGGLVAFLLRRHTTLPRDVVSSLGGGAVSVVLATVITGFTQTYIDNAGHLGGLVAGFAAGLALTPVDATSTATLPFRRLAAVAAAGVVIAALGVAALPRYGDYRRNVWEFVTLNGDALVTVSRSLNQLTMGSITEDASAKEIEQLIPPWRRQRSALAALRVPASEQALVSRMVRYMDARDRAWQLTADAVRARDLTLLARSQEAHGEAMRTSVTISVPRRRAPATAPVSGAITFGSSALNGEIRRVQRMDETFTKTFNVRMTRVQAGRMSLAEMAAVIEKEIIAPWAAQYERLTALDVHGPPDWARQPVAEFMRRRLEAWRLSARATRERNPSLMRQAETAHSDAVAFLKESQQHEMVVPRLER